MPLHYFYSPVDDRLQILAGIRSGNLTDFLRSSFCNDFTAFIAALWTEIDNVVSYFCHIEIMFDNDNCIPLIDQLLQYDKQFAYIFTMKSCKGYHPFLFSSVP